jgi:hypothetical protein
MNIFIRRNDIAPYVLHGEMRQESLHLARAHLGRMALVKVRHEAFNS